jgi:hypothetical protein
MAQNYTTSIRIRVPPPPTLAPSPIPPYSPPRPLPPSLPHHPKFKLFRVFCLVSLIFSFFTEAARSEFCPNVSFANSPGICLTDFYRMGQKHLTVFEIKKLMKEKVQFLDTFVDVFRNQCRINCCHQRLKITERSLRVPESH